jgi:tetratricopeptide (TPR) repeat protein
VALVAGARRLVDLMRLTAPRSALRRAAVSALVLLALWRGALAAVAFDWATTWRSPVELFRTSVESGPNPFRARANLARICKMAGQLDAAASLAEQSIEEAPWYAMSYNVLGDVETLRGDYRAACTNYVLAIEAQPGMPYPHFAAAFVYETHLNEPANAVAHYEQVLAFPWNRYSETAALNLSRLHALDGRVEDAIGVLKAALQHAPSSAALHHNLAIARRQLGPTPTNDSE